MDIEQQIQNLIDEAAPLRSLPPEEGEKLGLNRIILEINALRAIQQDASHQEFLAKVADAVAPGSSGFGVEVENAKVEGADTLEFEPDDSAEDNEPEAPMKRKPGRPPRVKADE